MHMTGEPVFFVVVWVEFTFLAIFILPGWLHATDQCSDQPRRRVRLQNPYSLWTAKIGTQKTAGGTYITFVKLVDFFQMLQSNFWLNKISVSVPFLMLSL